MEKPVPLKSSLTTVAGDKGVSTRKDRRGRLIIKGSKKYRVTFKDKILKTDLGEVFEVESYKEFNVVPDDPDFEKCSCNCSIF